MGSKIVRNNNEEWCHKHGVSGTWHTSRQPVGPLTRKVGEELQEFVEENDPAELFDLADVLRALLFLVDRDGHRAAHEDHGRVLPQLRPADVPGVTQRLWDRYGEFLGIRHPSLLLQMEDDVRALTALLDPYGTHAKAHAAKVAEMGSFSQYVMWDPVPEAPAQISSARVRRGGDITRWRADETYGFITDDAGQTWFVSRLPGAVLGPRVGHGARVTFTGAPRPARGQDYPEARGVRLAGDEQVAV